MGWQTVKRPGYFGKRREERIKQYNGEYGEGNWRIVWEIRDIVVDRLGAYALYEDAYFEFLKKHVAVRRRLIFEASDVYDDAPSNVNSGLDYTIQETDRTHLQDIAIRRCLVRMGLCFRGSQLIRIRDKDGTHQLSKILSPGHIPFHRPDLIRQPELTGWWTPGSVESFYQSNKVLQIQKKE